MELLIKKKVDTTKRLKHLALNAAKTVYILEQTISIFINVIDPNKAILDKLVDNMDTVIDKLKRRLIVRVERFEHQSYVLVFKLTSY